MQANPLSPNAADTRRTRTYRVVQWSTGTIGARALRAIIEHPQMSLAGVHVHGHDKVGRDAGDLCGMDTTGVTATASVDEIVELAPDCVLYMPSAMDLDELCRLLTSGINVVTTCEPTTCAPASARHFDWSPTRSACHSTPCTPAENWRSPHGKQ